METTGEQVIEQEEQRPEGYALDEGLRELELGAKDFEERWLAYIRESNEAVPKLRWAMIEIDREIRKLAAEGEVDLSNIEYQSDVLNKYVDIRFKEARSIPAAHPLLKMVAALTEREVGRHHDTVWANLDPRRMWVFSVRHAEGEGAVWPEIRVTAILDRESPDCKVVEEEVTQTVRRLICDELESQILTADAAVAEGGES
jgi:hypothetical protein